MSTHSPKEFFFLIEFKKTASICKIMMRYTKSANEKMFTGRCICSYLWFYVWFLPMVMLSAD